MYQRRNGQVVLQVTGHPGKEYRRLVAAFERIFGATIYFGTDSLTSKARLVQRFRLNFMSEAHIWYARSPEQPALSLQFENVIVLSEAFYQEIADQPRRFRGMLEQWLCVIWTMWPECPARISPDGRNLLVDHAPAAMPSQHKPDLP